MKRKILGVLLSVALCLGMATPAFAAEVDHGSESSTVNLTGTHTETSQANEAVSPAVVIGYRVQWHQPQITVGKVTKYGKVWNPSKLAYEPNENDPKPVVSYTANASIPSIADVTNLSNTAINVNCSFTPAAAFSGTGLTFTYVGIKGLSAASAGAVGGRTSISMREQSTDDFDQEVLAKVYDAMKDKSGSTTIGTFTISVSAAE